MSKDETIMTPSLAQSIEHSLKDYDPIDEKMEPLLKEIELLKEEISSLKKQIKK